MTATQKTKVAAVAVGVVGILSACAGDPLPESSPPQGSASIWVSGFVASSELPCTATLLSSNTVELVIGNGQGSSDVNAVVDFESPQMDAVRSVLITKDRIASGNRTFRNFSLEFYAAYDIPAGWPAPQIHRDGVSFRIEGKGKIAALKHGGGRSDPKNPLLPTFRISATCANKANITN